VGRVACDAIADCVPRGLRQRYVLRVYAQLLLFTYPYWLLNYRKHNVYRAAVNLALGCYPPNLVRHTRVSLHVKFCLIVLFVVSTAVGLLVPVALLGKLAGWIARLAKGLQRKPANALNSGAELPAS